MTSWSEVAKVSQNVVQHTAALRVFQQELVTLDWPTIHPSTQPVRLIHLHTSANKHSLVMSSLVDMWGYNIYIYIYYMHHMLTYRTSWLCMYYSPVYWYRASTSLGMTKAMMVIFEASTPSCKQETCQSSVGQRVPEYHQKIPRPQTSTQFFHSLVCSTPTSQKWTKMSTTPTQASSKLSLTTVLLSSAGDHDYAISAFLFRGSGYLIRCAMV